MWRRPKAAPYGVEEEEKGGGKKRREKKNKRRRGEKKRRENRNGPKAPPRPGRGVLPAGPSGSENAKVEGAPEGRVDFSILADAGPAGA